jgi:hypothetical protein
VQNGSIEFVFILNPRDGHSPRALIPRSIALLAAKHWDQCGEMKLITFELQARLSQIKSEAFKYSLLQWIEIPRNVEIIG